MKLFIVSVVLFGMVHSQSHPYNPSGGTFPGLLPKYTTTTTQNPNELVDRINENAGAEPQTGVEEPQTGFAPQPGSEIFPGTLEQTGTVTRVSEWPEDRQPFWYVNREYINSQRGQAQPNPNTQTFATRFGAVPVSPFAGRPTQREQERYENNYLVRKGLYGRPVWYQD